MKKIIGLAVVSVLLLSGCGGTSVASSVSEGTVTGCFDTVGNAKPCETTTYGFEYSFDDQLACEYFDKKSNNYEDTLYNFWNVYLKAIGSNIPGFADGAEMLHDGYDTDGLNSERVWKKGHSIVFNICSDIPPLTK